LNLSEKFRPQDWEDVVGQQHIIASLKEMIAKKEKPPALLFIGAPGTGKNTVAQIFAKHYLGEGWKSYLHEFNASDSRKLTDVREKIKPLSRVIVKQIINLTEADSMDHLAQPALRRIMETTKNTLFILDVNDETKVIPAIKSRCAEYRFSPLTEEHIIRRLVKICDSEGIKLTFSEEEKSGLRQIYKLSHGDMRKAINELEKIITANKQINAQSVLELNKTMNMMDECIKSALGGDFEKAKNTMEDAYIINGRNTELIMDSLLETISTLENEQIKLRLYYELGELEHRLQSTYRPLIPLFAFVSYVRIVPHLRRS